MKDPYRILPLHTKKELQALKESIQAHGLQDGVIIDAENHIIDGHARRDICEELGLDWLAGADVRVGLTDDQMRAMAISLNLARRTTAPTAKQRREYAEALLLANPDQSDECVAAVIGLDRSTVNRLRKQLVQTHKLKPVMQTVDRNGRARKVSSDRRQTARFITKSKKEYDKFAPAAHELKDSPQMTNGMVQRPYCLPAMLRRQTTLAEVAKAKTKSLPSDIDIQHCDFRTLKIKPGTVDLVFTDVVWGKDCQKDWNDLARLAKVWLKPKGLFATFIGQGYLDKCLAELSQHLNYAWTFCYVFSRFTRQIHSGIFEGWRPIVVFSVETKIDFRGVWDRIDPQGLPEKDYHDWQQPLPVVKELVRRLCPREGVPALVVDPQLGTGTTAVACAQLPGKRFVGCDIDANQVKIARHRIATEGAEKEAG
jgi:ParB-like chromosome segregation protein Spo0J